MLCLPVSIGTDADLLANQRYEALNTMFRFLLENAIELGGVVGVILGAAGFVWAAVTRNTT